MWFVFKGQSEVAATEIRQRMQEQDLWLQNAMAFMKMLTYVALFSFNMIVKWNNEIRWGFCASKTLISFIVSFHRLLVLGLPAENRLAFVHRNTVSKSQFSYFLVDKGFEPATSPAGLDFFEDRLRDMWIILLEEEVW